MVGYFWGDDNDVEVTTSTDDGTDYTDYPFDDDGNPVDGRDWD